MEGTLPAHFQPAEGDSTTRLAAKRWSETGRININARQVFPPGFRRPDAVNEKQSDACMQIG